MSKFKKTRDAIKEETTVLEEAIIHGADDKPLKKVVKETKSNVTVSGNISEENHQLLLRISEIEDRSLRKIIGRVLTKEIDRLAKEYGLK